MRSERGNPVPLLNLAELRRACPRKEMWRGLMRETGLCAETGERGESMICWMYYASLLKSLYIPLSREIRSLIVTV